MRAIKLGTDLPCHLDPSLGEGGDVHKIMKSCKVGRARFKKRE